MFRERVYSDGAAIDTTMPPVLSNRRLVAMTLHADAAPTTSETFTVTLLSVFGSAFDTVLYSLDLSGIGVTDIAKTDFDLPLIVGDALRVQYANTDANTFGIQLIME